MIRIPPMRFGGDLGISLLAGGVNRGLSSNLADRDLHFARIKSRWNSIEIQIGLGLIYTIKVLGISEFEYLIGTEAEGCVRRRFLRGCG
jgi:hypothetical protein